MSAATSVHARVAAGTQELASYLCIKPSGAARIIQFAADEFMAPIRLLN